MSVNYQTLNKEKLINVFCFKGGGFFFKTPRPLFIACINQISI